MSWSRPVTDGVLCLHSARPRWRERKESPPHSEALPLCLKRRSEELEGGSNHV